MMTDNRQSTSQAGSILARIHEGMEVYDRQNEHIGTVDEVHFGVASSIQRERGTGPATVSPADQTEDNSLVAMIAEVFNPREVPHVLADRLLRKGYIRLDSDGLFSADRYIMPEQIATLVDDKVYLAVRRSELVKK